MSNKPRVQPDAPLPERSDSAPRKRSASLKEIRTAAVSSVIGTTIEWYDFFLYGTAASVVFDKLYFPDADPVVGTLLS